MRTPMERLTTLLRRKIEKERVGPKEPQKGTREGTSGKRRSVSPSAPDGPPHARSCWLCGRDTSLRFRLKDTSALCFPCFHTAYVALVLPIIDTPKRRANDRQLACEIEKLRVASDAEMKVEAADPSRAPLMALSRFQTHHREQTNITNRSEELDLSKEFRVDSNNNSLAPVVVTTCPLCGVDLSDLYNSPLSSNIERSLCHNKEIHIIWKCQECGAVSTIEGDCCHSCKKPRVWSCRYCTTLHDIERSADGLRYCLTCGNYNTPEDIFIGQAMIQEEQEMAKRMAASDQTCSETEMMGSVVFGVNDSCTLLELERQQEIETNTHRLKCRLEKLQLKCSGQKDDGNCLFASLAHQLFGKAHLHHIIRFCVVAYMKENESDYRVFFNGKKEWQQYLSDMKKSGFWGDEICINAAARCFCVDIHVITSDATRWHLVFQHNQLGSSKSRLCHKTSVYSTAEEAELKSSSSCLHKSSNAADNVVCLFLVYKSPVHFDDIESSEAPCITLSDLLIPELYKLMQSERKKIASKTVQPRAARKTGAAFTQSASSQGPSKHPRKHNTHISSASVDSSIASNEGGVPPCDKDVLPQYAPGISMASTLDLPEAKAYETTTNNTSSAH
ncbi:unnamed protein product [Phytomonas sp. EM1]|nr:unnamed protein product [Phytomonas sp. EM1]|eukprot:CCW64850.1 unnamed protein product [Phytomonas sp. isolate EM1]